MTRDKVLIITSTEDAHSDYIIDKINKSGRSDTIIRLNTEMFNSNCISSFHNDYFTIQINDSKKIINSSEILSIWYRRPQKIKVENEPDEFVRAFIERESTAFLNGLYYATHENSRWVNPLPELEKSRYKVPQIKLANELGFKVPQTLISNDPQEILKFAKLNEQNGLIIKSLSQPHFYLDGELNPFLTRLVTLSDIEANILSIQKCQTLFQEFIKKVIDLRIIIFGDKIYSFEIHSQNNKYSEVDFRGVSPHLLEHKVHQLPDNVIEKIKKFVKKSGLLFSAIDLVMDELGEYYFLENNPNGQWLWLEIITKTPISDHFIDLLYEPFSN